MKKFSNILENEFIVYFSTLFFILCISIYVILNTPVINHDGICYLTSAQTIVDTGLKAGINICPQARWPLYSILIFGFSKILNLEMNTAAYILNILFTMISAATFLMILKALGGSKRILFLGAITILCAHQFLNVRDQIIRDHGYWAFYLLSIFFLLQFYHRSKLSSAILWSISITLAMLFRIEGIMFLFFAPLFVFFYKHYPFKKRLEYFFKLNIFTIFLFIFAIFAFAINYDFTLKHLSRIEEAVIQFKIALPLIFERYKAMKNVLETYLLDSNSIGNSKLILSMFVMAWYVALLVINLTIVYTFLILYGYFKKTFNNVEGDSVGVLKNRNCENIFVIKTFLIINLGITFVFFLQNLFLSSRYVMAFSLTIMLFVPFALNDLIKKAKFFKSYKFYLLLVFTLFATSLVTGVLEFGNRSKLFLKDAGLWIDKHVPQEASLYVNNERVMYYSNHFGKDMFNLYYKYMNLDTIADGKWRQFDYVALHLNRKKPDRVESLLKEIHLLPVHVFNDKRGVNSIIIFKVK